MARGVSKWQIPLLTVVDRGGRRLFSPIANRRNRTIEIALTLIIPDDAVLYSVSKNAIWRWRMIVLVAIPDAPKAKFLEKSCISVTITTATVELGLCGGGVDMKKTCPSCKGTGSVYGLGGSGPAGGANTTPCNVCDGTGMVEDYSLPEPDGDGDKLPFLVTVVATLCGLGAGYLSYQYSSFAGGYDKMMTAILVGAFAFIAVGILFKILTNPFRALMYFTVVWALDYFVLGRTLEAFIRNLFST